LIIREDSCNDENLKKDIITGDENDYCDFSYSLARLLVIPKINETELNLVYNNEL
jgi:hypothetical protein